MVTVATVKLHLLTFSTGCNTKSFESEFRGSYFQVDMHCI